MVINNEVEQRKKLSPFDIASMINEKKGLLGESELVDYSPYMINRILSNNQDTIFFANEMNSAWGLPKDMQFAFYYYGLPKKKRYAPWHKNQDDNDNLNLIEEYFGYSRNKAKQVLPLLHQHLDSIREELKKGGKQ